MKKKLSYVFLAMLTVVSTIWLSSTATKEVSADSKTAVEVEAPEVDEESFVAEEKKEIIEEVPEEVIVETGIELNTDNVKIDYTLDEELDLSGLQISLVYSNGEKEEVLTEDYAVREVDMSSYGTKEVTVFYKGFSQSFNVEVSFIVTDVETKTMYSKTSLNVRKGPSTDFDKAGTLNVNDEVKITGTCDNGWSRVDYNGEEAYVSTKYLSDKKIEVPKPAAVTSGNHSDTAKVAAEMASRPGMSGRLYIPSVGLNVALFNGWTQGVIDARDSAGTYRYGGGQMMIADHKNQGFSAIKSAVPGQTVAYINNGSTVQAYICTTKNTGQNTATGIPYDLLDCNGNSLYLQNAGGIGMYTCNSHWSSITYTCWQPI